MKVKKYFILLSVFAVLLTSGCIKRKDDGVSTPYNREYTCLLEKGDASSRVGFSRDENDMANLVYVSFEGSIDDFLKKDEQTSNIQNDISNKMSGIIHNFSLATTGENVKLEFAADAEEINKILNFLLEEDVDFSQEDKIDTKKLKKMLIEFGYKCNK